MIIIGSNFCNTSSSTNTTIISPNLCLIYDLIALCVPDRKRCSERRSVTDEYAEPGHTSCHDWREREPSSVAK